MSKINHDVTYDWNKFLNILIKFIELGKKILADHIGLDSICGKKENICDKRHMVPLI